MSICLFMLNTGHDWVSVPNPTAITFSDYNTKLEKIGVPALAGPGEMVMLRKTFEQKEKWESLLAPSPTHRSSIPDEYVSDESKCKWNDADLSILIKFSGSATAYADVIESTSGVPSLPYKSTITLNTLIDAYSSTTGLPNPSADANSLSDFTARRAIAQALGWSTQLMEERGLIKNLPAFNECGEQLSEKWPFFAGETALDLYKTLTGNTKAVGIPLHEFTSTELTNHLAWHTNLDPDQIRETTTASERTTGVAERVLGVSKRVTSVGKRVPSVGYRTKTAPTEGEKDWRHDGNIFLEEDANPSPEALRVIRHNEDIASTNILNPVRGNFSARIHAFQLMARGPLTPKHLKSGLTGESSRENTSKKLVCYPGIENDSLNSYPYKAPMSVGPLDQLPLVKTFEESITELTISAFMDMGYESTCLTVSPAETAEPQNCQDSPYCCRLYMEVEEGQKEFATKIKGVGTKEISDKEVDNAFFVERSFEQEVLVLSPKNTDKLFTGAYSYSIVSSVGVVAAFFQKTTSPAASNPKDIVFGHFKYLSNVNQIKDIDYSQRYLFIQGRGAGVIQVRVKDEVGCEALITIMVGPAKFGPCDFVQRGVGKLDITLQNDAGQRAWPELLVTSPEDVIGFPLAPDNKLAWAWDYNRDSGHRTQADPSFPSNGDGGGNGTFDTTKLELSISVTGGKGPYTVAPLNNSVYVCRKPSGWDGIGIAPKGFHQPRVQDTAPPPKVSGANQFGLKQGFEYGGKQPYFESSLEQPGVDAQELEKNGNVGTWQDDYKVYANKPGDKCFFKVTDALGCVIVQELRVPCATEVLIPPTGVAGVVNQGAWLARVGGGALATRMSLVDIYSSYIFEKGLLHLDIGLGEEEKASLADIIRYVSAPNDNSVDPTLAEIIANQDVAYNLLNGFWRLTNSIGSKMWSRDANQNLTNDLFRIPGLTHEVFTDKTIPFKIRPGDFYHGTESGRGTAMTIDDPNLIGIGRDIANSVLNGLGKNVLILKSRDNEFDPFAGAINKSRVTRDVNSTRVVRTQRIGEKIKFQTVNLGYATVNYFIDDGQGGCNIPLLIKSTPPEVIYGDFIQGHVWLDKPYTGASDIDTVQINHGNNNTLAFAGSEAYRIEEQFVRGNQLIMDGIPTLLEQYDENHSLPHTRRGFASGGGIHTEHTMDFGKKFPCGSLSGAVDTPDCPGVRSLDSFVLPLGISIPCGKGFYGIKIASRRFNYHESAAKYHYANPLSGLEVNTGILGWFESTSFGGGVGLTFPHQPSLDERKRKANGWQFDVHRNTQAAPLVYSLFKSLSGAGEWGHDDEMYPYMNNDANWKGNAVAAWGKTSEQFLDPPNPFAAAALGFWGHGYADLFTTESYNFGGGIGFSTVLGWPHNSFTADPANENLAIYKAYDIVVGAFESTFFSDVKLTAGGAPDTAQPEVEYDANQLRIIPTWSPFAETWRPPDEVYDEHISGYGWRWPKNEGMDLDGYPHINATPDRAFNSPAATENQYYVNTEFQCGNYIAASFPNEFAGMGPQKIGGVGIVDGLDSDCDEAPKDNIIISTVDDISGLSAQGLMNLVGTWVRITWKPGYNDDPDDPEEVAPDPHVLYGDWLKNDKEGYTTALDDELTKCYKILYIPNSEDFLNLKNNRTTSDGKNGFHTRSIGRIDANPKEVIENGVAKNTVDGYATCEKCAEEVVIKSCDGTLEYIVKRPDFRHLTDDALIFDDDWVWQLNYRLLSTPEGGPGALKNCFSFEKKNAYDGISSDEHGTNVAGTPLEEVEIQSFDADEIKQIRSGEGSKLESPIPVLAQRFLEALSSPPVTPVSTEYEVCSKVDIGYGEQELCTKGIDCASCEKSQEVTDITISPYCAVHAADDAPDCPDNPYKLPSGASRPFGSACYPINPVIKPSNWPTCASFSVVLTVDAYNKLSVTIENVFRPPGVKKVEDLFYQARQPMSFNVDIKSPGCNESRILTVGTGYLENSVSDSFDCDWSAFDGALDRDFLGTVSVYFGGFMACITQVQFDYQCDVLYTSSNYKFDRASNPEGECPDLEGCPSCELYSNEIIDRYPHHKVLYQQAAIIIETDQMFAGTVTSPIAYIFDEDFYLIKQQALEGGKEEIIFIDDTETINEKVYKVEDFHCATCVETEEAFTYTKHYNWDGSECYNYDDSRSSPNRPTKPKHYISKEGAAGEDDTIAEENFPLNDAQFADPSILDQQEDCKRVMISGRCGFLVIKNSKQGTCDPEETGNEVSFFHWCREYDGIRYGTNNAEGNDITVTQLDIAAKEKKTIIFGREGESSSYTRAQDKSTADAWNFKDIRRELMGQKSITVSSTPHDIEKVIEEFIPSLLSRQVTGADGTPIVFAHSTLGNETNNSPEGSLGEQAGAEVSNFLNQVKLKYLNPHEDLSKPFTLNCSDFLWTSTLESSGVDMSMQIEEISEEEYKDLRLIDIETSDPKISGQEITVDRKISLQNDSDQTYIIEAAMNPDSVKNFKLCEEEREKELPLQVKAQTIRSRKSFNESSGNSKFFIIKPNSATQVIFSDEKVINNNNLQEGEDYSANFFFRIVGGFYRNEISDSTTYLTTLDSKLTSASFEIWALLPSDAANDSKNFYQRGGRISIPTYNQFTVSWNGANYRLSKLFSNQSSSSIVGGLTIQ